MENTKKQTASFTVNLPSDLNEKIEADAVREKRSKAKQVEWIIERYYSLTPAEQIETAAV